MKYLRYLFLFSESSKALQRRITELEDEVFILSKKLEAKHESVSDHVVVNNASPISSANQSPNSAETASTLIETKHFAGAKQVGENLQLKHQIDELIAENIKLRSSTLQTSSPISTKALESYEEDDREQLKHDLKAADAEARYNIDFIILLYN